MSRDGSVLAIADVDRNSPSVLEYALDFSEYRLEPLDVFRVFAIITVQIVGILVVSVIAEIDVVRRRSNDEIDAV